MKRLIHISHNGKNARVALVTTPGTKGAEVSFISAKTRLPVQSVRIHRGFHQDKLKAVTSELLLAGNDEIDLERAGVIFDELQSGYAHPETGAIQQTFQRRVDTYGPDGVLKESNEFKAVASNTNLGTPLLTQTKRKFPLDVLFSKFVFSRQFQLCHEDGVQYDFLYQLARELEKEGAGLYIGSGSKGVEKLVFTDNGGAYNGFLVGRTDGDTYQLLLLCTQMELKLPAAAAATTEGASHA